MNRISIITLPVLVVFSLALGGCTREEVKSVPSGGTYLSVSGGASFDQAVTGTKENENIALYDLGKIHRSAQNPSIIFMAAGEKGMVISRDDAATWETIPTSLSGTVDVAMLHTGVLIATGIDKDGQGSVVRSLDNGKSWQNVFTLPLSQQKKTIRIIGGGSELVPAIISLEVDAQNDDMVWAGTNDGTIFSAEQSGKVWKKVAEIPTTAALVTGDRSGAAIVRLEGVAASWADVLMITRDKKMLAIKDGTVRTIAVPEVLDSPLAFGGVSGNRNILDVSLVPGFPNALIIGTDKGAVVTRDAGKTFVELRLPFDASKRVSNMVVAISPTNANRILVAADGIIYRSEDAGTAWQTANVGPIGFGITDISINPKNAARVLTVLKAIAS